MKTWIPSLTRLLGKPRVFTDPAILQAHAGDEWLAAKKPDAVVFAHETADVVKLMKFANRHQTPVTPRGGGRGAVGGCVPARGGIVLSLAKMNRIKEISPEDGLAVVEPGVITQRLQIQARKHGLFYPPDPASLETSTIGGNIATNAGGPRCLKYGVTGGYTLELEVVLPDGEVLQTGSRTMKNKAGFDLTSLFVGSEGLLGVVTEATLRLVPHPPAKAVVYAGFTGSKPAISAMNAIFQSGILPAALEIIDSATLRIARQYHQLPPGKSALLIELDGLGLREEIKRLERILSVQKAIHVTCAQDEASAEKLWQIRRKFSESLKATGLKKVNEDVAVPRSRIVDLFQLAESLEKRFGYTIACFGHAGDGNIHVNIMVPPETTEKQYEPVLSELFQSVCAWNGAITGEHGIGLAKKRWWRQTASPVSVKLHGRLKKVIDPNGILNPAKWLG